MPNVISNISTLSSCIDTSYMLVKTEALARLNDASNIPRRFFHSFASKRSIALYIAGSSGAINKTLKWFDFENYQSRAITIAMRRNAREISWVFKSRPRLEYL